VTAERVNPDGTDKDDWDYHWDLVGEASKGSPANIFRRELLDDLLGTIPQGAVFLDIGCGQGEFAVDFALAHPNIQVHGTDYSLEGVKRAARAAEAAGLTSRFFHRNLLEPVAPEPDVPLATHALCSEVLEHVEDPVLLMRNALSLLQPGAKVVVTVPGGPRSAFAKYIGHYKHYKADELRTVLEEAGLEVDRVITAGFPFFNLFQVAMIVRGEKFVEALKQRDPAAPPPAIEKLGTKLFAQAFKFNRSESKHGWQIAAIAHVPIVSS
jgi:2-polyprenyl-3-methyl-5-hydroxy-6-metoxy-1,4-benzoquinol methylase